MELHGSDIVQVTQKREQAPPELVAPHLDLIVITYLDVIAPSVSHLDRSRRVFACNLNSRRQSLTRSASRLASLHLVSPPDTNKGCEA